MKFPIYTKQQYRKDLIEQIQILADMIKEPTVSITRDTVINIMRLCFDIRKELYKLDNEIQ